MMRSVVISENQKVTADDFNNFGVFPRFAFDTLIRDAVDDGMKYAGFPVVQASPAEVTVGAGRFYKNGQVFYRDDAGGVTIDMIDFLPAVAERIATIVVYGNAVDTALEPRTFLVDAVTRQTEGRDVATENRRVAEVSAVYGVENATPVPPAVDGNYVAVADVRLSPAGIIGITVRTENKLSSVKANYLALLEIEAWRRRNDAILESLRSQIRSLSSELSTKASLTNLNGLLLDLADLKERAGLPDTYVNYGADDYDNADESDTAAVGYDAQTRDGLRFPLAASQNVGLALENPLEDRVVVNDNLALPRFSEYVGLSVLGNDDEHALTSTTVETVTKVRKTVTRTRRVYQEAECIRIFRLSSNAGQSHYYNGQRSPHLQGVLPTGWNHHRVVDIALPTEEDMASPDYYHGAEVVVVQRVQSPWNPGGDYTPGGYVEETFEEPYWETVTQTETVAGSIAAQTFLAAQDGYVTGLNLAFTRKASSGDVRVFLAEVSDTGMPRVDAVLAEATLTPADIAIYPTLTAVDFVPTFVRRGRRYCVILISSGAHFVSLVEGNKLAEGTIFFSTDGAFFQGDLNQDLAMEVRMAQFNYPYLTVQLAAAELAGGFDGIGINADAITPPGTRIDFQVRIDGVWKTLGPYFGILTSRPALAAVRAVFSGTTNVMPALGLGSSRSGIETWRKKDAFTHVSIGRLMGSSVNTVKVIHRIEAWSPSEHSLTTTLLTGAGYDTEEVHDSLVEYVPPSNPTGLVREYTFNLGSAQTQFKIKTVGATTSSAKHYHVASTRYVAT